MAGGGRTEVHATGSADVETRMGGVIEVYGNPSEDVIKPLSEEKLISTNHESQRRDRKVSLRALNRPYNLFIFPHKIISKS